MGSVSSSGYGHSFLDFFKSTGDFGGAIIGTLSGDTSGWGKWTNDMKSYGNDIAQTFTGKQYTRYDLPAPGDTSYSTGSSRLQSSGGSTIGVSAISSNPRSAVSAVYSNIGYVPPSNIQAISDPATKMAIAGSRGIQRQSVNLSNASMDISSASSLSTAQ